MKLVIAEKPSVAQEYAKVLGATTRKDGHIEGNGYVVSWCYGHLVTLKTPDEYTNHNWKKWELEQLPIIPDPFELKTIPSSISQYKHVKELMNRSDVDEIIVGTDAGREGELIFRHVYNFSNCQKPFKRLWLNSLTREDIEKGFRNLKNGRAYDSLYDAAYGRQIADWLYGMNISRLLSLKYKTGLSYGRVQTPTLQMIVERHNQLVNFKKTYTYKLEAHKSQKTIFSTEEIERKEDVEQLQQRINQKELEVVDKKVERKKTSPPKLFDLTLLQRTCNQKFSFTAKKTLDLAQSLYEKKLITYPRTDSNFINQTMKQEVFNLASRFLETSNYSTVDFIPNYDLSINDAKVTDHHAILPTKNATSQVDVTNDEQKVLDCIILRFLASGCSERRYEVCKVTARVDGVDFVATTTKEYDAGWTAIEKQQKKDNDAYNEELFSMEQGDRFVPIQLSIKEIEKKPKPEYTEATLLSAMENAGKQDFKLIEDLERVGLGTPATRASIIEELINHGYVTRNKKSLVPTDKGIQLVGLVENKLKNPDLSVEWEKRLSDIKNGKDSFHDFISDLEHNLNSIIENYKNKEEINMSFNQNNEVIGRCPVCGGDVIEINTKKGTFYKCENNKQEDGTCDVFIGDSIRHYGQSVPVNKQKLKTLLNGKEITATLKSKEGKDYQATMKLIVNQYEGKNYINLERTGFVNKKK